MWCRIAWGLRQMDDRQPANKKKKSDEPRVDSGKEGMKIAQRVRDLPSASLWGTALPLAKNQEVLQMTWCHNGFQDHSLGRLIMRGEAGREIRRWLFFFWEEFGRSYKHRERENENKDSLNSKQQWKQWENKEKRGERREEWETWGKKTVSNVQTSPPLHNLQQVRKNSKREVWERETERLGAKHVREKGGISLRTKTKRKVKERIAPQKIVSQGPKHCSKTGKSREEVRDKGRVEIGTRLRETEAEMSPLPSIAFFRIIRPLSAFPPCNGEKGSKWRRGEGEGSLGSDLESSPFSHWSRRWRLAGNSKLRARATYWRNAQSK